VPVACTDARRYRGILRAEFRALLQAGALKTAAKTAAEIRIVTTLRILPPAPAPAPPPAPGRDLYDRRKARSLSHFRPISGAAPSLRAVPLPYLDAARGSGTNCPLRMPFRTPLSGVDIAARNRNRSVTVIIVSGIMSSFAAEDSGETARETRPVSVSSSGLGN